MQNKTYEQWLTDLLTFSGSTPSPFTELELRRFHSQGCDPQMIRSLSPDAMGKGRSIRSVDILYSDISTVRACQDSAWGH